MRSDKPKVLHEIGGQAMLRRVYNTACQLRPACIHIVYGFGGDQIRKDMADLKNVRPSSSAPGTRSGRPCPTSRTMTSSL